jgi:hypothetical protein
MRKIIRAEVVPWEIADAEGEEDLYGVAYERAPFGLSHLSALRVKALTFAASPPVMIVSCIRMYASAAGGDNSCLAA